MNDQSSHEHNHGDHCQSFGSILRKTIRSHIQPIRKQVMSRSIFSLSETHRLRVKIRKATACLHLCGPILAEKPASKLEKDLSRFRREFGPLRDGDVLLERSLEWKGLIPGEQLGDLVVEVVRRRLKAAKQIKKQLDSNRLRDFESSLNNWKNVLPKDPSFDPSDLRQLLCTQISSYLETLRTPIRFEPLHVDLIHSCRISCRHIRYHLEAAESLSAQGLGELVAGFKRGQQDLGQIHDTLMILEQLGKRGKKSIRLSNKSLSRIVEAESNGLSSRMAEFTAWWTSDQLVQRLLHAFAV